MGCTACQAKYKRLHQAFAKPVPLPQLSAEQQVELQQERLRKRALRGVIRKAKQEK